jgi:hypothetical protein
MPATRIINGNPDRETLRKWVTQAPFGTTVTLKKPGRTIPQNDRMWAMLTDVATQVQHNGRRYSIEQWKCLFMHACGHETHFMTGLSGEPFPAGFRSSSLTKEQMSEMMDFMESWGAENGVKFTGSGQ